jgi:anti-sigma factor RsiW
MSDCSNPGIQDLLPDLIHGRLDAVSAARVETHVATCDECARSLAMLRSVRDALHAGTRAIPAAHVAAIVARLPRPSAAATSSSDVIDLSSEREARRRPMGHGGRWRLAAAIGVIAIGGMSVTIAQRGLLGIPGRAPDTAVQIAAVANSTASESQIPATRGVPDTASVAISDAAPASSTRTSPSQLTTPVGELDDLSERELQGLLDGLDRWDGATAVEPPPATPPIHGGADAVDR